MILRKTYIGPAVDLWSLGVLLFVMVTGTLPFSDPKVSKLMTMVAMGKYSIPETVSVSCSDLIRKIIQVKPADRLSLEGIRNHTWTNEGYERKIIFRNDSYVPGPVVLDSATVETLQRHNFTEQEIQEYCQYRIPGRVKALVYLSKQSLKIKTESLGDEGYRGTAATPKTPRYQTNSATEEESTLLSTLRSKIEATYLKIDYQDDAILFDHPESRQYIQGLMLKNLIGNGGRILFIDEDYPELFYGAFRVQPPEMFDQPLIEDEELASCLETVTTFEVQFSALTMTSNEGHHRTCFRLLNGFDQEWLMTCFPKLIECIVLCDDNY